MRLTRRFRIAIVRNSASGYRAISRWANDDVIGSDDDVIDVDISDVGDDHDIDINGKSDVKRGKNGQKGTKNVKISAKNDQKGTKTDTFPSIPTSNTSKKGLSRVASADILHLMTPPGPPGWEHVSLPIHSLFDRRFMASQHLLDEIKKLIESRDIDHESSYESRESSVNSSIQESSQESSDKVHTSSHDTVHNSSRDTSSNSSRDTSDTSRSFDKMRVLRPATSLLAPMAGSHGPRGQPVIGFLGRIDEQKDPATWFQTAVELSDAMARNVSFRIVGDGPMAYAFFSSMVREEEEGSKGKERVKKKKRRRG